MSSHDYSTDPDDPRYSGGLVPSQQPQAPDPQDEAQTVDQIAVRKLGGFNFLDPQQWVNLPRSDRMQLIKNGSVVFLYQGEEVSVRSALLYLQTLSSPRISRAGEGTGFAGLDMGTPQPGEI